MVSVLDFTPGIGWTPCIAYGGVLLQSMRTWLCCLGRGDSRWGLVHPGNSALAFETWPAHYRTQRACDHTKKNPNYLLWRWCIVSMPPPFLFANNPNLRSKQEKCPAPTKLSNISWILGRGQESFFMCTFKQWTSMQNHRPPSFFLTNTTALHHALWLDSARLQHLLQMVLNLLNQGQGNSPKSFLKGSVICHFDHVLSRMSTS